MESGYCCDPQRNGTPPKFNNEFSPESHDGTGRRSGFLLGFGNFSGALAVKLREGKALIAGLIEAGGFP